jgi:hypothetical protein
MKQIYINTRFGTTRIDYNPFDDTDIIIVASPGTTVEAVVREPIECSGINPESIVNFGNIDNVTFEPTWNESI